MGISNKKQLAAAAAMPAAEMEHEQPAAGMGAEAADMATSEVEAASAAIGAVAIRQQNMKAATAATLAAELGAAMGAAAIEAASQTMLAVDIEPEAAETAPFTGLNSHSSSVRQQQQLRSNSH
jgi:hypothetical protein